MTIRTDVSLDWDVSPRIVTVAAPSTAITIQDLHDTLRDFEDTMEGMAHPKLIDSSGKEELSGGLSVGITSTLQDALLAFEARGGPTYEICRVFGGNLVAIDDLGAVVDTPIYSTAFVQVVLANSTSAALINQEEMALHLTELWKLQGLDSTNPMTVTPSSRDVDDISMTITGDGLTTSTVTRQ